MISVTLQNGQLDIVTEGTHVTLSNEVASVAVELLEHLQSEYGRSIAVAVFRQIAKELKITSIKM